ncbi:hypothetical protein [Thermus filiformis]|uniref:hypothetical protein n=1 Tax=Thermus filiformis TaxID=276 RepID=UPI00126A3069|nr:hypothetical protein [Thermus filiformis]
MDLMTVASPEGEDQVAPVPVSGGEPASPQEERGVAPPEKGTVYFAVLWVQGTLTWRWFRPPPRPGKGGNASPQGEHGKKGDRLERRYQVTASGHRLSLLRPAPRKRFVRELNKRMAKAGSGELLALIWPRTGKSGTLAWDRSIVYRAYLLKEGEEAKPGFQARGRLLEVNRDDGYLLLEIRPNPQGILKRPFTLTVFASLALMDGLPPVGSGVYLEGDVRLATGRLVARKVEPAKLWDDGA